MDEVQFRRYLTETCGIESPSDTLEDLHATLT
jgi:hypothetical protein